MINVLSHLHLKKVYFKQNIVIIKLFKKLINQRQKLINQRQKAYKPKTKAYKPKTKAYKPKTKASFTNFTTTTLIPALRYIHVYIYNW